MNKFQRVHKQITEQRRVSLCGRSSQGEIGRVKRDQRQEQRSLRKHARVINDKVSAMRGNKFGWTFATLHGGREYRVVGEPCLVCGRDHKYHRS